MDRGLIIVSSNDMYLGSDYLINNAKQTCLRVQNVFGKHYFLQLCFFCTPASCEIILVM